MKRKLRYRVENRQVERDINYIPVRYILAILIAVLEVAAIIGILAALCYYVPLFYLLAWATEIACVVKIIASDDNPDYKVPWLIIVLLIPLAGFMAYFLFYSRTIPKKYLKRLQEIKSSAYTKDDTAELAELEAQSPQAASQARMLRSIAETHVFSRTKQAFFPLGENMHEQMLRDLSQAEKFIYMEYFIVEEGAFWNSTLDILKEKAQAGLDVRVVYDDVGCMMTLPGNYAQILQYCGILATPFSCVKGNADSEFNNRSHRKILVIDGKVGYTGGVNLADEYINAIERFGHWKDTAIRLEGEAVQELTRLFLIDFGLNYKKPLAAHADCYGAYEAFDGAGYVIPFGDGPRPLYNRRVGKSVIQNMLACATRYAYMTTPYLIIDNDLCLSLENAALRGVDVRIIVPHIPDKKLVFEMTKSFYPRLMEAGVRIYEYTPGFIHAKQYLVDDEYAMIGTINLDYRSLVHHFENGVWMYRCSSIQDLKNDIEDTLQKSEEILRTEMKTSFLQQVVRSVVRLFAPML